MPKSPHMSRREFVAIVAAATGTVMGATIGLPAIGYLTAPALQKVSADAWIPAGLWIIIPLEPQHYLISIAPRLTVGRPRLIATGYILFGMKMARSWRFRIDALT